MNATADDCIEDEFFARLPSMSEASHTFDAANYRPAPSEWLLVVTDIEHSTLAIADGRHNTVNIVAASAIAALKNLCAPTSVPFLFGGDGAVVLVPPRYENEARVLLARLRGFAQREFNLNLRIGLVAIKTIRSLGADVLIGRYEPSPGNDFGVFQGGGVSLLEATVKRTGSAELGAACEISSSLDDGNPVDMTGLSCRWNALKSLNGRMVTLIIQKATMTQDLFSEIMRLAAVAGNPQPVRRETLKASWPSKGFVLEARIGRGKSSLIVAMARVLLQTLIARLVFARKKPIGQFDPDRYREEVARNTDFCKYDDTLCMVLDCPTASIEAIQLLLESRAAQSELRYGMHISDIALMTCLVSSVTNNRHVHFVDGGDGGYTNAATKLKADQVDDTPAQVFS